MSGEAGRVVDVHAHAMPLPILEWLVEQGLADLSGLSDGIVRLDPRVSGVGPGAPLPLPPAMHDVSVRLGQMDQAGVDVHAVSLPPFLMATTFPIASEADSALVSEVIRRGNDALAEYVAQAPDRLVALGGVPLGTGEAATEAARCLDELGMAGIAICSQGAGQDLDAEVNEPLWALLSQRSVFTFLHPSASPAPARTKDFWFPQLVGYPMETALAVARLIFAGVTTRHPFPLCLAHGGGCLPSLRGRLSMGWDRKPQAHTIDTDPREHLDRLYYDTAVFDEELLRGLVAMVGPEQVLAGTDFPFDLAEWDPVGFVTRALGKDAAELVLGRTAAGLLGLQDS
ncbi:amidohydrolase family protein [Granulicoccus phenolivorans]|uniref:amidohydrolase family protein n=1 Tax=Granulicoccus phenolivorans TaxID=266854 RepID=UPI00041EACDC|nr:amidohydrolase family protein [Granulicoccus phenolivorans]